MKKLLTFLTVILFTATTFAQAPQKMSYQAVLRNSANQLITNQLVGMRICILLGSATGTAVYIETQSSTTNANGLVSLEIGDGVPLTGTFSSIDWSNGYYFIKTETDPTGGTSYSITGTSQLLSVPYALYAKTAANGLSDNYIVPRIATKGQRLSVSFSGGDNLTFSQSSSTCPNVYADVILKFTQSSTTIILPVDKYYINSKRFDAVFNIPSNAPSGVYDVILGPYSPCPFTISTSFKIY